MQPQQLMNAFPLPIMPDDHLDAPMTVQRWGALLLCSPSLLILHCSDNTDSVLSYAPRELLSHPLSSIVDRLTVEAMRAEADERRGSGEVYAQRDVVLHSGAAVHLVMHAVLNRYVVDVLPVVDAEYSDEDVEDSAADLQRRLLAAKDAAECSQAAVEVVTGCCSSTAVSSFASFPHTATVR